MKGASLTSTTQVTAVRGVTSSITVPEINVQVVEFRDGTLVTTGSLTMGSGTATGTGTLVGVDTSRATGLLTLRNGSGASAGSTAYVADDIPGVASATATVTNSTTVTLTRASTVASATFHWQVIEWGGPSWWNASWQQRYPITVTTTSSALPSSYSVPVALDHASLVSASRSLASGNDVRVVSFDGAAWTELDRYLDPASAWNSASTTLWVRLPVTMSTSSGYTRLFLYVTNASAGWPPATAGNVFQFYDGFESNSLASWTTTDNGGLFSVASDQAARGTYAMKVGTTSTFSRIRANGLSEADVQVSASMRVSGNNSTIDVAVGARAETGSSGNEYLVEAWNGAWHLGKQRNGTYTSLGSSTGVPALNTWVRVAIEAVGGSQDLLVNGTQLVVASDGQVSAADSASVTVWTVASGANVWIDEVIARKLVAVEPTTALGAVLWR